jgi:hypothetical protein
MPRRVESKQVDKKAENPKDEPKLENPKDEPKFENLKDEPKLENSKITDKAKDEERRFIVSLKENKLNMITNNFEPREMLAFSQLRTLNQKELIQSLDQNDKLGIVIKDKLQVAMINMEKYQLLVEAVHEYSRLLEWLEEQELFKRVDHRLKNPVWEEVPEGKSLWEWAGLEVKG